MLKFVIKCLWRVARWRSRWRRTARGHIDRRTGMIVLRRLPRMEKVQKLQRLQKLRKYKPARRGNLSKFLKI